MTTAHRTRTIAVSDEERADVARVLAALPGPCASITRVRLGQH